MSIWWLALIFALGCVAHAQQSERRAEAAPAALVSFLIGSPLSFQQVEEYVRDLPDGGSTVEITKSTVYRDSAGRLSIERVPSHAGEFAAISMIDPTSGIRVRLSTGSKIAYRVVGPKAGENGFAYGIGGVGEGLPLGVWKTNTEKLGHRTIDGIEVEGQRVTQISPDEPSRVAVYERWYSDELNVDFLAVSSGPGWKHTARIHSLRRQEPDPSRFAIPPDYEISDLQLPRP